MKILDAKDFKMRLPNAKEWDSLVRNKKYSDDILGSGICFWLDGWSSMYKRRAELGKQLTGYESAWDFDVDSPWKRQPYFGFRPVFEPPESKPIPRDVVGGDIVVVGTLYMNGSPVRVPERTLQYWNFESYIPDTALELREALDDPEYQVKAFRAKHILVCDRTLINNISYFDIINALR